MWCGVCRLHSWRRGTPCLLLLGRQSSAGHQRSGLPGLPSARLRFQSSLGLQINCVLNFTVVCQPLFTHTPFFKRVFFTMITCMLCWLYITFLTFTAVHVVRVDGKERDVLLPPCVSGVHRHVIIYWCFQRTEKRQM